METANGLSGLRTLPPDVAAAWPVVAGMDGLLVSGFARLSGDQREFLSGLSAVFAGTPLAGALSAATADILEGRFSPEGFRVLARARAGLLGAAHDALIAQAAEALGRRVATAPACTGGEADADQRVLLDASGHFLAEVAIAGLARLEASVLEPFDATLARLQGSPGLFRLAALLTGLSRELHRSIPVTDLAAIPATRWADLWTRAMLLTAGLPPTEAAISVEGTFLPLGVELRTHSHTSRLTVRGLLDTGEAGRAEVAEIVTSRWKVEVICGSEEWRGYQASDKELLSALAMGRRVKIKGAYRPGAGAIAASAVAGDGGPMDLVGAASLLLPGAAEAPEIRPALPFDRHPIQIAIPVRVDEAVTAAGRLAGLPVRVGAEIAPTITPQALQQAIRVVALLRFDAGGWYLAPLAAQIGGKKPTLAGAASLLSNPKLLGKQDRLTILRGKAKNLLRKK